MDCFRSLRGVGLVLMLVLISQAANATTTKHRKPHSAAAAAASAKPKPALASKSVRLAKTAANVRAVSYTSTRAGVIHTQQSSIFSSHHRRSLYSPWTEPTFADSTMGDSIEGEDLVVRKAATDALGPYNGTVVVADPQTGRILSIVNQRLAKTGAFQPCSTIKVVVSLASLSEKIVDAQSPLRITPRFSMSMTQALAKSNNQYFARLGEELGFERVIRYGKLFGLGEKAGLDLDGEEAGELPESVPDDGVGMMTSFGSGIRLTPLELAGIVTAVANGGTLYYLQYPKNMEAIKTFQPRVKRFLDIADLIPQIKPGMMGAVEYGTARRAVYDENDPLAGKTGTCTDTTRPGVHLGWFGSFNDVGKNKLVVVVLLTGGRGVSGPIASGIAGNVYRSLSGQNYFAQDRILSPANLVSMQSCCR
jgi:penicillin-binding protein 2